jgi:hypothetical protein
VQPLSLSLSEHICMESFFLSELIFWRKHLWGILQDVTREYSLMCEVKVKQYGFTSIQHRHNLDSLLQLTKLCQVDMANAEGDSNSI